MGTLKQHFIFTRRWDLFPGISGGDLPASSKDDADSGHLHELPSFPSKSSTVPATIMPLPSKAPGKKRPKQVMNDLLAQTFDVQAMEEAE